MFLPHLLLPRVRMPYAFRPVVAGSRRVERRIFAACRPYSALSVDVTARGADSNIPDHIWMKRLRGLHQEPDSPVSLLVQSLASVEADVAASRRDSAKTQQVYVDRCVERAATLRKRSGAPPDGTNAPSDALEALSAHLQSCRMKMFGDLPPLSSTRACFDDLGTPMNHVSRSRSDTYYVDDSTVLRPHTSVHQVPLLRAGERNFFVAGHVFRRDTIDRTHYPVFHQLEAVTLWPGAKSAASTPGARRLRTDSRGESDRSCWRSWLIAAHLQLTMEDVLHVTLSRVGMASKSETPHDIFRWVDSYFPFTAPSFELEVLHAGEWVEVAGAGVVSDEVIVRGCGEEDTAAGLSGWAYGIGIERIAMRLFRVPDIRLFWSRDPRFTGQFSLAKMDSVAHRVAAGTLSREGAAGEMSFAPFSKYPHTDKDISFWMPQTLLNSVARFAGMKDNDDLYAASAGDDESSADVPLDEGGGVMPKALAIKVINDLSEVARAVAGDAVEELSVIDVFRHPKTGRTSMAVRLKYRAMDRTLTSEEVNLWQCNVIERAALEMGIEIRT